jgi:hypothetical protein
MGKRFILTEQERKEILGLYEQMVISERPSNKPVTNSVLDKILDIDNIVDVASAGIDTVPEIGNLISAGIDIVHAGTYAYRYANATTDQQKIEYAIMGIITLITAAYPIEGNKMNIVAREGLGPFLRRSPEEILHLLQKMGLYNKKIWAFQKEKWTFNTGLFLYKAARSQVDGFIPPLYNKIKQILKMVKGTKLEKPFLDFKDVVDSIRFDKEIYSKLGQYA